MDWGIWHLIGIGIAFFVLHHLITDEKFRHGLIARIGALVLFVLAAWLLSECSWGGGGDPDRFRGWR